MRHTPCTADTPQVGIIPTDTLPAIVADLENRDAIIKLYAVKEMSTKKPLSILCRNFQDLSHYTAGLPVSNEPGSPNWFNIIRRILPGPYTLILPASKNLPSQMVDFMRGKTIHRKSVGVRITDDPVCQALAAKPGNPHQSDVLGVMAMLVHWVFVARGRPDSRGATRLIGASHGGSGPPCEDRPASSAWGTFP